MAEVTRGEINDIIAGFANKNVMYRGALLANPKHVLAHQMGQRLPDFLNVEVIEEDPDTIYLVLPYQAGEELSDADLELVAGGKKDEGGGNTYECQVYGAGNMGTHNEIDTEMSVF